MSKQERKVGFAECALLLLFTSVLPSANTQAIIWEGGNFTEVNGTVPELWEDGNRFVSEALSIDESSVLEIMCPIPENINNRDLRWTKDSKLIYASHQLDPSVGGIDVLDSGALRINNVTRTDSGVWSCFTETLSFEFPLFVKYPPVVVVDIPKKVCENDAVTLVCRVVAFPIPQIWWYYEERNKLNVVVGYESVLEIPHVTENTTYCCAAENGIGGVQISCVDVDLEDKPMIEATNAVHYKASNTLELSCFVNSSEPKPIIFWEIGTRFFVKENFTKSSRTSYVLTVKVSNVTMQQQFGAACRVFSKVGTCIASLTLCMSESGKSPYSCEDDNGIKYEAFIYLYVVFGGLCCSLIICVIYQAVFSHCRFGNDGTQAPHTSTALDVVPGDGKEMVPLLPRSGNETASRLPTSGKEGSPNSEFLV